jgi:signal transduction histidine kinase
MAQPGEERGPAVKTLAVDDNPANLIALCGILERLDTEVVVAHSGPEALMLAARDTFAVILLDVMMPEMDGFETLVRLRHIPGARTTPVVLVTAYDLDAMEIERAQGGGMVDYIRKPVPPELLRSKVAALVALHRRGEELRRRDEALSAKDRDIAVLAHDLQRPLTVILAAGGMLARARLDDRAAVNAARVARAATQMSEMIQSLTDFARAGRGPFPVAPERMNLGQLCRDVVDDFRLTETAGQIELGCSGELDGQWDRNRLHQALANLLGNALRYGSGPVAIRAHGEGARVEVAVHNDGPPIDAALMSSIFRPFARGGQHGAVLGLGLYIVREIAKAHHGEVSVTSSREAGTTFLLQLPRA